MDDQYTFENKTYKDTYRHTTSHILAQAMKRLYPEVKLAIGPAIEDGFYYDFDSPQPFTPEVLEKLESLNGYYLSCIIARETRQAKE